jgi:hypothetical protein
MELEKIALGWGIPRKCFVKSIWAGTLQFVFSSYIIYSTIKRHKCYFDRFFFFFYTFLNRRFSRCALDAFGLCKNLLNHFHSFHKTICCSYGNSHYLVDKQMKQIEQLVRVKKDMKVTEAEFDQFFMSCKIW